MGNHDEFDLDVRLGSSTSLSGPPRAQEGRDVTNKCGTDQTCADQETCGTCDTQCAETCFHTFVTCPGQNTCAPLCVVTDHSCNSCFTDCGTCPGQNTCAPQNTCDTCDTCHTCVTDCGQVTCFHTCDTCHGQHTCDLPCLPPQ